jgi:hypothetical protein
MPSLQQQLQVAAALLRSCWMQSCQAALAEGM